MQNYTTIVLFAARQGKNAITGKLFTTLVQTVLDSFCLAGRRLSCRGSVLAGGKDINPRGGPWSLPKLEPWAKSIDDGNFLNFELAHRKTAGKDADRDYFFTITNYGRRRDSDTDEDGNFFPPLSLTTAIPPDDIIGREQEWDDLCQRLSVQMKAVFGFMESERPWGLPSIIGTGYLMDLRGHDVPNLEYGSGTRGRMDERVSRLRWRCILRRAHIKGDLDDLRAQPFVECLKELKHGIIYLAFRHDPELNPRIAAQAAPFFNFVLPDEDD